MKLHSVLTQSTMSQLYCLSIRRSLY